MLQQRQSRTNSSRSGSSYGSSRSTDSQRTSNSRPGSRSSNSSSRPRFDRPMQGAGRPTRVQKTMDIDYNILIKEAKPVAITDYTPSKTFAEHGLSDHLVQSLTAKGYTQPTPIQDQIMGHIMGRKDVIGIANTGTGKTAAFLLPLIDQVYNDLNKSILVLAPTRELAGQIYTELKSFVNHSSVSSTLVVGGVGPQTQINSLRKHKNFIISTTGRGLDLINQGFFPIGTVDTIVLDEMDQMLDMGFISDIRKILGMAKNCRHLLFFSATTSPSINKIAGELLTNPVTVSVVQGQTSDNVNQDVITVGPDDNKFDMLCELLQKPEVSKAIVFENTKHGSARIERELVKRGFKALAIHGNKNQNQRTRALDAFKQGHINVLIATNVAARGLDIPQVSHVINYSLPQSKEDYTHRIGRTGRAGEVGQAYTFIDKR